MKLAIIHPYLKEPIIEKDRQSVSINELNRIPFSSCTSIYVADTLDFIKVNDRMNAMSQAISKLRYGGIIIFRGLDLMEVSRLVFSKEIDVGMAQQALYNNRQSSESLSGMLSQLKEMGLELVSSYIDNMFYQVEARRPNAQQE